MCKPKELIKKLSQGLPSSYLYVEFKTDLKTYCILYIKAIPLVKCIKNTMPLHAIHLSPNLD